MMRQTACKSLEESERLFHGFVVHIVPGKSKRDSAGKLASVKDAASSSKPIAAKPRVITHDTIIREMSVSLREDIKKDCKETGKYLPNKKKKAKKGIRYKTEGNGRIVQP